MAAEMISRSRLLERGLRARPDASTDEVRRLAPLLATVGEGDLKAQIRQIRLRLAEKRTQPSEARRTR
ncbi:MAG: hypothetical protein ACK4QW_18115 [Alphaproteobacteria bacterium]